MAQNFTNNKHQSNSARILSFQLFLRFYRKKMNKTLHFVSKQDVQDLFRRICGINTSVYTVPGAGWNVFWKKYDGTVEAFTIASKDGMVS